jgi:hypothetical protein
MVPLAATTVLMLQKEAFKAKTHLETTTGLHHQMATPQRLVVVITILTLQDRRHIPIAVPLALLEVVALLVLIHMALLVLIHMAPSIPRVFLHQLLQRQPVTRHQVEHPRRFSLLPWPVAVFWL